jgi:hypothetical protein
MTNPNDYAEFDLPPARLPSLGQLAAYIAPAILAVVVVAISWSRYY